MDTDIVIQAENLSKVYSLRNPPIRENDRKLTELKALDNVSFEIRRGESVGIIGPNGSGKSTLLKILAGVTKPTSGKVTLKGRIASILDIGAGFHLELSGRQNIFLNGQIHGFSRAEISEQFDRIVDFSGIREFIDEPVKNYSNGMYLRLAFSIMAHMSFDIYLIDEVLTVGDIMFQREVLRLMESTYSTRTFVIVSHELPSLLKLSDKVYGIRQGILTPLDKDIGDVMTLFGGEASFEKTSYSFNSAHIEIPAARYRFLFNEEIEIGFRMTFLEQRIYDVFFNLYNEHGYLLMSDSPSFRQKGVQVRSFEPGCMYHFSIRISPHHLSVGTYYVRFVVGNGINSAESSPDLIRIVIDSNPKIDYLSLNSVFNRSTSVLPLDWTIEKT